MGEIVFKDLTLKEKGKLLLEELNFSIGEGELFMIKGPSAAQNKAVLRLIQGFATPSLGSVKVELEEQNFSVGSNLVPFLGELTAKQSLALPLIARGYSKVESDNKIYEIAKYFSLEEVMDIQVKDLAKEEKALLGVAKAVVAEPSLVLLEEFSPYLDHKVAVLVMTYLHEISVDFEVTVVMVENDRRLHPFAAKILHLEDKRIKDLVGEGVDLNKLMPFLKI
ncbi:ATP-binding cassette domain-containing protein [bacterium]|nr:ATP-binding cassette domain-containing protein [bacterium]